MVLLNAVDARAGSFRIEGIPSGTHTREAWHEVYGTGTQTVVIEAGAVTAVDLICPGDTI